MTSGYSLYVYAGMCWRLNLCIADMCVVCVRMYVHCENVSACMCVLYA